MGLNFMRVTRDMAVFDDHLPLGIKLAGYALGFTLTIVVHIASLISAPFLSAPHSNPGSRHGSTSVEPKRLNH